MPFVNGNSGSGGGSGSTETSVQINVPWVDVSAANGTAGRAGAVTSKAILVKSGNKVTMHLKGFNIANVANERKYLQTYYDFNPALYPEEFPIPLAYRPVETIVQMIGTPGLIANGITYNGYLIVGAEGYLEINPTFQFGTLVQPDGFASGGTVGNNGYGIIVSWNIGPAFT